MARCFKVKMGPSSPWRKSAIFFGILIFWTFGVKPGQGFVVIADQNRIDGWILFDSQIRLPPPPGLDYGSNTTQWSYQYRVSHHKTQAWVHRFIHLDSDGQLQFRRHYYAHKCQLSQILPSSFIVYVDVIAKPVTFPTKRGEDESDSVAKSSTQLKNELARQFFDYISFPVTIIFKQSNECGQNQLSSTDKSQGEGENGLSSTFNGDISRTVDDIYVALPIDWEDRCFHSSEKLGNVLDFLPASVRLQCEVKAGVGSDSGYTWAIQSNTNDIVLKRDWCLFEPYHTIQLVGE